LRFALFGYKVFVMVFLRKAIKNGFFFSVVAVLDLNVALAHDSAARACDLILLTFI
jgi:hypothetical protein